MEWLTENWQRNCLLPPSLAAAEHFLWNNTRKKSYSTNLYKAQCIMSAEHWWCKNHHILISSRLTTDESILSPEFDTLNTLSYDFLQNKILISPCPPIYVYLSLILKTPKVIFNMSHISAETFCFMLGTNICHFPFTSHLYSSQRISSL